MFSSLIALISATGPVMDRPNVVYILADDVGYGDLSSYGATRVKTPNIDSIGKNGVRFTDAHSPSAVCTPTRYSLLTGQYAFRHAPGAGILNGVAPLCIPKSRKTLPQVLQQVGYTTGVVGKWHLGLGEPVSDYNKLLEPGPKQVGFDSSFIIPATGDRVPCVYVENGRVVGYDPKDPIEVNFQKKVGTEPTGRENPELLKLKPVVGHADTIVNGVSRIGFMTGGKKARWVDEDMADTLARKATEFISKNHRKPFFLYLATHDVHAPLLPNHRFNGKSQAGLRGDTLAELDWTVGEVIRALKETGTLENTILVFTSDNGGAESDGYSDPRENLNGHRVNGSLRGEKYTLYEGGHRVPMLISWPRKMAKDRVSEALVSQTDFMASIAQLLGVALGPEDAPDSMPLASCFFEGGNRGRTDLVYHKGGAQSPLGYREGRYTLVYQGGKWELYNLGTDPGQKTNLADQEPARVARMIESLERIKNSASTRRAGR